MTSCIFLIDHSPYFCTSMDIHIRPTYLKSFCPNFFLEKVWLRNTLPTYNLDIRPKPKFRSVLFNALLSVKSCLDVTLYKHLFRHIRTPVLTGYPPNEKLSIILHPGGGGRGKPKVDWSQFGKEGMTGQKEWWKVVEGN